MFSGNANLLYHPPTRIPKNVKSLFKLHSSYIGKTDLISHVTNKLCYVHHEILKLEKNLNTSKIEAWLIMNWGLIEC